MLRLPVSNYHQMVGNISLTYRTFYNFQLLDIVKMKSTYSEFMPGLARIYFTLRPDDRKEEITVN